MRMHMMAMRQSGFGYCVVEIGGEQLEAQQQAGGTTALGLLTNDAGK